LQIAGTAIMNDTRSETETAGAAMRATFDAQRSAFARESATSLRQRHSDLAKLRDAVEKNADRLAAAISADFGNRSRHETEIGEVLPVLAAIRYARRHLRNWMQPKHVAVSPELLPGRARILYQPVGVVGIISPWNYPFQLAVAPLIAALSAGNRAMLKPSELTPRTANFLAELLAALFPADQVATVLGGAETGRAFAALPFDHLFYTGSTAVGRLVMKAAAENLTPVTLELGGKSPCILAEDAALPGAVEIGRAHV
jgi:coniferyl-aldehyde dehydrogenase